MKMINRPHPEANREVVEALRAALTAPVAAPAAPAVAAHPLAGWPIAGIRVDQGTVVIVAKGNERAADHAARWMCGELSAMKSAAPTAQPEPSDAQIDALDTFRLHHFAPRGRETVRAFARAVLALRGTK